MSKIERRSVTVYLHSGAVLDRITELAEAVEAAEPVDAEQKRHGTKSTAMAAAKEHDEFVADAEKQAVPVKLWAVTRKDWARIADEHPPREDERQDSLYGVNMKTFPDALVGFALLPPDTGGSYEEHVKLADEAAAEYEDLSQMHWMKLVHGTWGVNTGDDDLPKYSLVSRLRERNERDSKPPPGSVSPRPGSTGGNQPKPTNT